MGAWGDLCGCNVKQWADKTFVTPQGKFGVVPAKQNGSAVVAPDAGVCHELPMAVTNVFISQHLAPTDGNAEDWRAHAA